MKLTILGCGPSGGVPLIGCNCAVCSSSHPHNKRTRASLLIREKKASILVDTSPDLRAQILRTAIQKVDAIIYTHAHADHIHGIDDVRSFNYHADAAIPIYGDKETLDEIKERFAYCFREPLKHKGWFRPCLIPHEFCPGDKINVAGMAIQTIYQDHGFAHSVGIRVGNVAYSTDVKSLSDEALKQLEGLEVWIVDCLAPQVSPAHADLATVKQWVKQIKPKLTILTHMGHQMDYEKLETSLPPGIIAAYDGMVIEV